MHRIFFTGLLLAFFVTRAQSQSTITGVISDNIYVKRLLPIPQQVNITPSVFQLDKTWTLQYGSGVTANDPAASSLKEELQGRYGIGLTDIETNGNGKTREILLELVPGAVQIGETTDTNRLALTKQAYSLTLSQNKITVTANAGPGLYYGVQTLLQLLIKENDRLLFPEAVIRDWPDMDLRIIYWDDAHHLEYLDVLKREIKQASYFKINAFTLKLEGHFQYESAKPVVEPHALSAKEYQELTNYALAHYVQLIPWLDAPSHVSFILKHPEYAGLRAFPNSNYEFNVADPATDDLIMGMFDDLINANKGVGYIIFSTDEAYYTGKSPLEAAASKAAGGNSRLLAQFITRIGNKLNQRHRKALFWGEYPLTLDDIKDLPAHLINGVYDSAWAPAFKKQGMRQMIYTYTQGEEALFPNYYPLPASLFLHNSNTATTGNLPAILETVNQALANKNADLMGVIVAGWADAGIHPETCWLGYAAGASAGWNNRNVTSEQLTERFYNAFYRSGTIQIENVYRMLDNQARFFDDSWEWQNSDLRTPIFGNHAEIYKTPHPALDQTLPPLPIPSGKNLSIQKPWSEINGKRLGLCEIFLKENDKLIALLHQNLRSVEDNRYNLEVMLSIAGLCRQNLLMIKGMARIDQLLSLSSATAATRPASAVSLIDQSLDLATDILEERNKTLGELITTWYKDWRPLVAEANGRKYLQQVDDVKDHEPVRTIDMSYLVYRQLHYPLQKWAGETLKARNNFAKQHNLPFRNYQLPWTLLE